jgi:hypothetical protein
MTSSYAPRGAELGVFLWAKKERRANTVAKSKVLSGLFVALLFVLVAQSAMAQSTIFNIPSTDTVDKGKGYFEFDFLPQAPGPDVGSSTKEFNPRLVIGLPKDAEFGVNFPTFHNSGAFPVDSGYIQPNFKWKFYKNDDKGLAMVGGIVWNKALNNSGVQDSWGYIYSDFSKKVKSGSYGPRITFGPYGVLSANQDPASGPVSFTGPRAGAVLGYEQPLSSKVSFVADWFSGKNGLGYFTPGISITAGPNLFNAGYSIGNDSWQNSNATKNRYVFLYYGITF